MSFVSHVLEFRDLGFGSGFGHVLEFGDLGFGSGFGLRLRVSGLGLGSAVRSGLQHKAPRS